jgi:hypothetical protein
MRGVFKLNQPPGAEKDDVLSPIQMDYLIGSYATGILQYPVDMINDIFFETGDPGSAFEKIDPFGYKKKGLNIVKPKPKKTSRKFNLKEPWTIVTSRFQSENVIQNSLFHKEWYRIKLRAKELGVLDLTNLDTAKDLNVRLLKIFDKIETNLDNNDPLMSEETKDYMQLGGVIKDFFPKIAEWRKLRKTTELLPDMSSEEKRIQINSILSAENILLHEMFKAIASMDLDHILSDTMRASLSGPISIDLKTYGERKD